MYYESQILYMKSSVVKIVLFTGLYLLVTNVIHAQRFPTILSEKDCSEMKEQFRLLYKEIDNLNQHLKDFSHVTNEPYSIHIQDFISLYVVDIVTNGLVQSEFTEEEYLEELSIPSYFGNWRRFYKDRGLSKIVKEPHYDDFFYQRKTTGDIIGFFSYKVEVNWAKEVDHDAGPQVKADTFRRDLCHTVKVIFTYDKGKWVGKIDAIRLQFDKLMPHLTPLPCVPEKLYVTISPDQHTSFEYGKPMSLVLKTNIQGGTWRIYVIDSLSKKTKHIPIIELENESYTKDDPNYQDIKDIINIPEYPFILLHPQSKHTKKYRLVIEHLESRTKSHEDSFICQFYKKIDISPILSKYKGIKKNQPIVIPVKHQEISDAFKINWFITRAIEKTDIDSVMIFVYKNNQIFDTIYHIEHYRKNSVGKYIHASRLSNIIDTIPPDYYSAEWVINVKKIDDYKATYTIRVISASDNSVFAESNKFRFMGSAGIRETKKIPFYAIWKVKARREYTELIRQNDTAWIEYNKDREQLMPKITKLIVNEGKGGIYRYITNTITWETSNITSDTLQLLAIHENFDIRKFRKKRNKYEYKPILLAKDIFMDAYRTEKKFIFEMDQFLPRTTLDQIVKKPKSWHLMLVEQPKGHSYLSNLLLRNNYIKPNDVSLLGYIPRKIERDMDKKKDAKDWYKLLNIPYYVTSDTLHEIKAIITRKEDVLRPSIKTLGEKYKIKWNFYDIPIIKVDSMNIVLSRNGGIICPIAAHVDPKREEFLWEIPDDISPDNYSIDILIFAAEQKPIIIGGIGKVTIRSRKHKKTK